MHMLSMDSCPYLIPNDLVTFIVFQVEYGHNIADLSNPKS